MRLCVMLMVVVGIVWLTYQFWRLLTGGTMWSSSPPGGWDLWLRTREVAQWFSDKPIPLRRGHYPPATYLMLWPFLGWMGPQNLSESYMAILRPGFALVSVGCLIWLVRQTLKHSRVSDSPEFLLQKRFLMLVPISMYATGATIGNGQHIIHVLPMLIAAIFLSGQPGTSWTRDTCAALLFIGSLIKPQISAPFFWLLVFVPGHLRVATLTVFGYLLLTLIALNFQPTIDISDYFKTVQAIISSTATSVRFSDVGALLRHVNLASWGVAALLGIVAVLGAWMWRYRRADIWLLLGVTAIVSRGLMYHRWFDDLILLLPLITLFRLATATNASPSRKATAGILFGAMWLSLLAPGGFYLFPSPLNVVYAFGQTGIWLIVLIYLVVVTMRKEPVSSLRTS